MVRITGPLHSDTARKQIGHTVIHKIFNKGSFATAYNKPGSVKPFTPSASQITMRGYMTNARDAWAGLPDSDKTAWRNFVIPKHG